MKKYYCLIPARGGSKGIKGKNIKLLEGKPLIAYTIECAKESRIFEKIFVSTDDSQIAKVAKDYGAQIPFMRDASLGGDRTHMFKVYKEFAKKLTAIKDEDILMILLPTNPLRNIEDIHLVKNAYENDKDLEWVFTCNECEHHPYRAVRVCEKTNIMQPFFPIENKVMWSNRQELPKAYRFNGAIISGKTGLIRNNEEYPIDSFNYMDAKVKGVVSSEYSRLDIDTMLDFRFIESLLKIVK
ncbi:acylneuraminate cytidylyltransferase family protein [Prochlorococcus marinus]|uniref:CMP-N-acetylneuraminic acid synthetase n=1 Tax=Prochlorococcus marinus (strain AS9601) TaxID=146891 RepID=A2BS65_PROMS|nr:acylneuraminate cytidylyltransferase family protein [Prochlorococcus marinus]ABM70626.1 CMP-N-acetylneuraminic acid synthetase [Prochlorococcus marinus str. AS9601]